MRKLNNTPSANTPAPQHTETQHGEVSDTADDVGIREQTRRNEKRGGQNGQYDAQGEDLELARVTLCAGEFHVDGGYPRDAHFQILRKV